MNAPAGISDSNRRLLVTLHRHSSGVVDIAETARLLSLDRVRASKLLAHWETQGWVRRLRRGLYLLIPLEAASPEGWAPDPWLVATHLFSPGYVAGWSAAEHWGLTEQIFRSIAVFTAAPLRQRELTVDHTTFVLRHVPPRHLFGLRPVWRSGVAVQVSDPSRTVVDILDHPRWGGGIRHASEILDAYLASPERDEALLLHYLRRLGNAAAARRLGYLCELRAGPGSPFLAELQGLVTSGYVRLDPTVPAQGPYLSRWKLRANVSLPHRDSER